MVGFTTFLIELAGAAVGWCLLKPNWQAVLIRALIWVCTWGSLLAIAFVSLFCVAALSLDFAYLLVCLALPRSDVWLEAMGPRWIAAWTVTWWSQAPFWLHVLPACSPLLIHEMANLTLTSQQIVFKRLVPSFPSVSLVAAREEGNGNSRPDLFVLLGARVSLPAIFLICHGLPEDWRLILLCFLLDVAPLVGNELAARCGLWRRRLQSQLPWRLRYPVLHANADDASSLGSRGDEDQCDVHGTCAICLSALCCRGAGLAARSAMAAVRRRQLGPRLSVLRQQFPPLAGGAFNLSAARATAAKWGGAGRIATTRCHHSFHSHCIAAAMAAAPRCPQCRREILKDAPGNIVLPDEETMDSQMLSLAFGLVMGGALLTAHLGVQELTRRLLLTEEGGAVNASDATVVGVAT